MIHVRFLLLMSLPTSSSFILSGKSSSCNFFNLNTVFKKVNDIVSVRRLNAFEHLIPIFKIFRISG